MQLTFADQYTGIEILGEKEMPIKRDIKEILNKMDGDSDEEGLQILSGTVYYALDIFKGVLYAIALFSIIIAGFRIITAQGDEGAIKTNRNTIMFSLFGLMIILIADTAVRNVFYGGGDTSVHDIGPGDCLLNPKECALHGSKELLGIVYWGKTILAVIAVLEIIISGIRMITAIGNDNIVDQEKKVFMWVGIGLLLLAIDTVVIEKVLYIVDEDTKIKAYNDRLDIDTDLQQGINEFIGVIQFILQFLGILAVVALMYGGFLMLMDFGDEEKVGTAKKVITNAIIGIVIALSAYALVSTVML